MIAVRDDRRERRRDTLGLCFRLAACCCCCCCCLLLGRWEEEGEQRKKTTGRLPVQEQHSSALLTPCRYVESWLVSTGRRGMGERFGKGSGEKKKGLKPGVNRKGWNEGRQPW